MKYTTFQKKYLSEEQFNEIQNTILQYFEFPAWNTEQFAACLPYLQHDKKNKHGKIKFVLLKNIGEFSLNTEKSLVFTPPFGQDTRYLPHSH